MTIAFPCEQCGHRFEVDGSLAGKKCRCKRCGHIFLIPVPRQLSGSSGVSRNPAKTFGQPPSSTASPRPAAPAVKRPRPAPTLDPYFDEDDTFAASKRSDPAPMDDEEFLPPRPPGPSSAPKARKKKKGSGTGFDFEQLPWKVFTYGMGVVLGLSLISIVNVKAGVHSAVLAYFLVCFLLYAIGGIGTIAVPFTESVVCGLLNLFLPFYSLYYLITRWQAMKTWFFTTLGAGVLVGFGGVMMGILLPAVNVAWVPPGGARGVPTRPELRGQAPPFQVPPALNLTPPVPAHNIRVPAPGADEVVLDVTGLTDQETTQFFGDQLGKLLETMTPKPHFRGFGAKDRMAYTLKPAADLQVIADRITWARVTRVNGRTVEVFMPPLRPDQRRPTESVAASLPPPTPPTPAGPPADADFIDQVLTDLRSPQGRKGAMNRLSHAPPDEARRAEVAKAVEPMLRDPDSWTRADAARALAVWGVKENTPALVQALKDPDGWVVGAVLDALKLTADPAAAEAVAALIPENGRRGKAVEVLKAIGRPAEPFVIKYLSHSDLWVRKDVCELMKQVGGSEEGKLALAELVRKTNGQGFDGMGARDALQTLGPPKTPPGRRKSVVPGAGRRR